MNLKLFVPVFFIIATSFIQSLAQQDNAYPLHRAIKCYEDKKNWDHLTNLNAPMQVVCRTNEKRTPSLEGIKTILDNRINTNTQDEFGSTPLHLAASRGCPEVVELLLANPNTNPNLKNSWDMTPLEYAIYSEVRTAIPSSLQLLLNDKRVQVDVLKCLSIAMEGEYVEYVPIMRQLLSYWKSQEHHNISDSQNVLTAALAIAVSLNRAYASQILIENGASSKV